MNRFCIDRSTAFVEVVEVGEACKMEELALCGSVFLRVEQAFFEYRIQSEWRE
jgi:hypothetical protein